MPRILERAANRTPLVTIGIPTRNRRAYLQSCLQSVLGQTWPCLEVVVSDNASTDDTRTFLEGVHDPRLEVLHQAENVGLNGNWRRCLDAARGDYFLILSDDDLLAPTAIEVLLRGFLEAAPSATPVALSYARCRVISSDDRVLWETDAGPRREGGLEFFRGYAEGRRGFYPCALLAPTAAVRETRAFEEENGPFLDLALLLGLATRGDAAHSQEVLVSYRLHRANSTARCAILESRDLASKILAAAEARLAAEGRQAEQALLRKAAPELLAGILVWVASHAIAARRHLPQVARELWEARRDIVTARLVRRAIGQVGKSIRLFVR